MSQEDQEETGSDPVAETLSRLSEALELDERYGWSRGICKAVLEALEDAVRPHQQYDDPHMALEEGDPGWCTLDGHEWPCPTYRQVRDTLEGLL